VSRVLVALFAWAWIAAAAAGEPPPGLIALDGRDAPALQLSDMDGRVTDLADLRGGWVLVHFWASWCGPCRREMPTLDGLRAEIAPEALRIVLVNTAETDEEVFAFLAIAAPGLDTLMDRDGSATQRWQPRGLPSTFLVDPQGKLRFLALGGRSWDQPPLLDFVRRLAVPEGPKTTAGSLH
jgi:thiol-disulfide isomerase/thioredoxin